MHPDLGLFFLYSAPLYLYWDNSDGVCGDKKGEILIKGATVRIVSEMEAGREFVFEVTGTSLKHKEEEEEGDDQAVMLLASESAIETAHWVSSLRLASKTEEIQIAVEQRDQRRV